MSDTNTALADDHTGGSGADTIHLTLLGPPGLRRGTQRWPLERKDAALLAMLAEHGAASRHDIALLQWPGASPALARTSLRQRLYRLRRSLGCDVATGGAVITLASTVQHDLGDPLPALRQDPDSLADELLAGLDYTDNDGLHVWVDAARARWQQRRSEAWPAWLRRMKPPARWPPRCVTPRGWCNRRRWPNAHRRVMRLHYRRGDRAAALAAYAHCRAVLAAQLDAAPGAETEALAALAGDNSTAQAARAEVAVAAPLVATLRPPRLVGRDAELALVQAALADGRIAVVQGEAGIGKTRLLEELCGGPLPKGGVSLFSGARAGDSRLPLALLARLVRAGHGRWPDALGAQPPWVHDALASLLPELGPAATRRVTHGQLQRARLRRAPRHVDHAQPGVAAAGGDAQQADPHGARIQLELRRPDGRRAGRRGRRPAAGATGRRAAVAERPFEGEMTMHSRPTASPSRSAAVARLAATALPAALLALLLGACGKQDAAPPVASKPAAAKTTSASAEPASTLAPADCPAKTSSPSAAPAAPAGPDVIGIRLGMSPAEALNVVQCASPKAFISQSDRWVQNINTHGQKLGTQMFSARSGDTAPCDLRKMTLSDSLRCGEGNVVWKHVSELVTVATPGAPGSEHVRGMWRTQRFVAGQEPTVDAAIEALQKKYGPDAVRSNPPQAGGTVVLHWLRDPAGQDMPPSHPQYRQCANNLQPQVEGAQRWAEDCGLTVVAHIVRSNGNAALAAEVSVGIADQGQLMLATDGLQAALDGLDAARRQRGLKGARNTAVKL